MHIIKYRKIFITIGLAVMLISTILIFGLGLKSGIDFTGGALTEVSYENRPDKEAVEAKLQPLNLGTFSVRPTVEETGKHGYIIRTRDLSETERLAVEDTLMSDGEGAEVTRFTSIGPVIGQELRDKAGWAIGGVVLIIILYVAYAFSGLRNPVGSFVYGGITIFVLIHDMLVPAALMALLGHFAGIEIDVLFVMALLAVLGYSVNDTIVIFDRVRENLLKHRIEKIKKVKNSHGQTEEEVEYTYQKPFSEIVDDSVSETWVRSVNTSLTTFFTLGALYFIGGNVTQTFALVLMVGVVAGTYSSIFLANPLLVWVAERSANKETAQK